VSDLGRNVRFLPYLPLLSYPDSASPLCHPRCGRTHGIHATRRAEGCLESKSDPKNPHMSVLCRFPLSGFALQCLNLRLKVARTIDSWQSGHFGACRARQTRTLWCITDGCFCCDVRIGTFVLPVLPRYVRFAPNPVCPVCEVERGPTISGHSRLSRGTFVRIVRSEMS
jgi:hypothetical protein